VIDAALEENAVFDRLIKALEARALPGIVEKLAIDKDLAADPRYTKPYYTSDSKPYRNRGNLLHIYEPADGDAMGTSIALNAHVDTVAPFFKPYLRNGELYGRGACDDKGCCVAILGATILLEKLRRSFNIAPRARVVSMFVIDEESGGNGSLALAKDARISRLYDAIVISESTQGQIHTANRGAVWYKVDFGDESAESTMFALKVVTAFEKAGKALRHASNHPQFPSRPVQTCQGILGKYGEHPSGICGYIEFSISARKLELDKLIKPIESGLAKFTAEYGDRTKIIDPRTNTPKIDKHYELVQRDDDILLKVYGNTGHMGSSLENDNAIAKAAYILMEVRHWDMETLIGLGQKSSRSLLLEGGQGFLPDHGIDQVKSIMENALLSAYNEETLRNSYRGPFPKLSFDKLHNEAFARDPNSIEAIMAIEAAQLAGITVTLPLTGFPVSCDARLFANIHPEKQVLTVGPGSIRYAHADDENINIAELAQSCVFYALYILSLTGAVGRV
jgi:acetylornithine deacetylase/succinyl-diaminopimelate desuccinylase-like protein